MNIPIIRACLILCLVILIPAGCKKTENPIKFPLGTFPDSSLAMEKVNSVYDDYNTGLSDYTLYGDLKFIFSSNRGSSGGQFDLNQGVLSFIFDQTDGTFELSVDLSNDPFITRLINKAVTSGNDFGPYRLFSSIDGFEYMILASQTTGGDLDFYYTRNIPAFGTTLPEISGPLPANLLNTDSDDAYICFDFNQDTCYFSSSRDGNFDIYLKGKSSETSLTTWFDGSYSAAVKVDSINSTADDKCPYIYRDLMIFSSNRPGGMGGYDLYYSVFKKGKWSFPLNLGPEFNTSADEYRPVIGRHDDFTNYFMIFSSDRPGGKGGFDLYFRGIDTPENME